MKHNSLEITVISVETRLYDTESASNLTGIHPDLITEFERGKLVAHREVDHSGAPLFDESGLCRLRLLADLREKEKLSLRMMRSVCHLMDRLERAEDEVRRLRNLRR